MKKATVEKDKYFEAAHIAQKDTGRNMAEVNSCLVTKKSNFVTSTVHFLTIALSMSYICGITKFYNRTY